MYSRVFSDYKAGQSDFPEDPCLNLGLAIKQIRLRMGMTQNELASHAKMKLNALTTLENGYAQFTKLAVIEAIARVLQTTVAEIILEAQEWSGANFFVIKEAATGEARKRRAKRREETWFRKKPVSFEGFHFQFISPPAAGPRHFCFAILEIGPGKKIEGLNLPLACQVGGFVQRGSLKIIYDDKIEVDVFGNQGFTLRGDKRHSLINTDRDNSLRCFLVWQMPYGNLLSKSGEKKKGNPGISVGGALEHLRESYATAMPYGLSIPQLSRLSGLEETSLRYLEKTSRPDQVIYWNKIERVCNALKVPMRSFLELAEGKNEGYLHRATAHDRALIDYRHYLGVRLKPTLPPSPASRYHLSEMYLEPQEGSRRVLWKRRDDAMIGLVVEEGELLAEVGKNRKASLKAGESVYFDGSLGYLLSNPGTKAAKLLIASFPPIIF